MANIFYGVVIRTDLEIRCQFGAVWDTNCHFAPHHALFVLRHTSAYCHRVRHQPKQHSLRLLDFPSTQDDKFPSQRVSTFRVPPSAIVHATCAWIISALMPSSAVELPCVRRILIVFVL